ncbi:MAG: AtpZ/AtpI family protein [Moorellales bacterium]
MQDRRQSWEAWVRYANVAFSFGTTMAVSLLLGFFGGRWLDRRLGTEPAFMVVGVLLGAALAFKNLFDELGIFGPKEGGANKEGRTNNGGNQDTN